jgi:L-proline---[L-prolyl-carrier protein] ligase
MMLHEAALSQASKLAGRTALVWGDTRLTYGALAASSARIASRMRRDGVGLGDRVALYLPKQPAAVAAMLATSRLGAIYVPIDAMAPAAYALTIIESSQPRLIVTNSAMAGALRPQGERNCTLRCAEDILRESTSPGQTEISGPDLGPEAPALILYTSGTTAKPKGVVISHSAAWAFANWAADEVALSQRDVILNLAPFHFDLSLFDLFGGLSRGATVMLGTEGLSSLPHEIAALIWRERVSVIYTVPSVLRLLWETGNLSRGDWATLRMIMFAGEVFPIHALRGFMRALPHATYLNLYGPTETNVCLYYRLTGVPPDEALEIPIGRPCPGTEVSLLGEDGDTVVPGAVGELFVDGPSVMLGYWTGDRVQRSPRPYPTGDLAVERGEFLFRGRRDLMLKVRGHRLEPEGIEAVLCAHDGVSEAVVTAHGDTLVAAVVARHDRLSTIQIKQHCGKLLPPYMVPHKVVLIDELPKRSNGKIDRRAVHTLAHERLAGLRPIVANPP